MSMKINFLVGMILPVALLVSGCATPAPNSQDQSAEIPSNAVSSQSMVAPAPYEIVEAKDASHKAMERSLSDYSIQELEALPTDKKMIYRVVLSVQEGTEAEAESTVHAIIKKLTTEDGDIDEISLMLYSDKELSGGAYDIGSATWAPMGELGHVTPRIAQSNDRSSYSLAIDIRDDLKEYLEQRGKEETNFGMTEAERRIFFKEIVAAEDRAHEEAEQRFPTNMNNPKWNKATAKDDLMKNVDLSRQLADKYRAAVRAKYNLTLEQQREISSEAHREEWPLD